MPSGYLSHDACSRAFTQGIRKLGDFFWLELRQSIAIEIDPEARIAAYVANLRWPLLKRERDLKKTGDLVFSRVAKVDDYRTHIEPLPHNR